MNRNHKSMSKNVRRVAAGVLAAAVGFGTVACGTSSSATKVENKKAAAKSESEKLEKTIESTSSFGDKADEAAEKLETVYVSADAEGGSDKVTVSNWLRNYNGEKTIADKSNLTDIQNVKGNQKFTKGADGALTWNADGKDIYYQGKTSESLPVGVKVSYKLNGKDITPENLAGKSGKVTIRFDYTNTAKTTVNVNGQEKEMTVPFAMISGAILPEDNFSNIQVTNGKVVSDANNNIVMGVALPGLSDALSIDRTKLTDLGVNADTTIPDYVEITADTTNFELGPTLTMASANVLGDLGFGEYDNSDAINSIKDDMNTLQDSMNQLVNGGSTLKNGADTLKNGTGTLKNGVGTLQQGAGQLQNGVNAYTDGVAKLTAGAKELNDKLGTLTDGSQQLADGLSKLDSELSKMDLSEIQKELGPLTTLMGYYDSVNNALKAENYTTAFSTAKALANSDMREGLKTAKSSYTAIQSETNNVTNTSVGNALLTGLGNQILNSKTTVSVDGKDQEVTMSQALGVMGVKDAAKQQTVAEDLAVLTLANRVASGKKADTTYLSSDDGFAKDVASNIESVKKVQAAVPSADFDSAIKILFYAGQLASANKSENVTGFVPQAAQAGQAVWNGAFDAVKNGQKDQKGNVTQAGVVDTLGSTALSTIEATVKAAAAQGGQSLGNTDAEKEANAQLIAKYAIVKATENATGKTTGKVNYSNFLNQAFLEEAATQAAGELSKIQSVAGAVKTWDSNTAKSIQENRGYTSDLKTSDFAEGTDNYKWMSTTGMTQTEWKYLAAWAEVNDDDNANTAAEFLVKYEAFNKKYSTLKTAYDSAMKRLQDLTGSVTELKNGVSQLNNGAALLNNGIQNQLKPGVLALYNGAALLNSNSAALNSGASQLAGGANQLASGAAQLDSGAGQLAAGAGTLSDGLVKFNDEGIEKISQAFTGDVSQFADQLKAVDEAGKSYTTFSGAADNMPSSVKFIIETDEVSADKD